VPATLNAMFWDGLWGMAFGAAAPRLTAPVGTAGAGVALAAGALAIYWLVVLPLKGLGIGGGFALRPTLETLLFDLVFGLGTALLYAVLSRPAHQTSSPIAR
jgi:hypothetical protein